MRTRRIPSLHRIGSALALVLVLAGCTKGGQFDPVELFSNDMFDTKKKVIGERQPVFPEGVPGTTTGVPQDLMKGYQQPPDQADTAAAPAPVAEAKPKPKPKPKPKLAAAPVSAPRQQQQPSAQDPVWNQPPPGPGPTRITVAPGSQQQSAPSQSPWPGPPQGAAASKPVQPAWPNPPASGTTSQ